MKTILIIEDDKNINELLQEILKTNGYQVISAYSGTEALLVHNQNIDLILLDLMLPGKSGEEIITKLKEIKNVPILVTSALSDIQKKLTLFSLGADDYLTKPFNHEELLARIKVHLRNQNPKEKNMIECGDIKLNSSTYCVTCNQKEIIFSKTEFAILKLLMQNANQVVTKSTIFDTVWDPITSADENTLNVHISKIRNKLKKGNQTKDYIETIWSIGYKFKN